MIVDIVYVLISFIIYVHSFVFQTQYDLYLLAICVSLYSIYQLVKIYKVEKTLFFINPIFISTILTFFLQLGSLSILILYLLNGKNVLHEYAAVLENEPQWLSKSMYLTSWASFIYWKGIKSKIFDNIYKWIKNLFTFKLISGSKISQKKLIYLALFAYLFKAYLYSIGLFGRILSEDYFIPGEGYRGIYFFRIFGDISYITFFLICINKFTNDIKSNRILFYTSLILELFFGFIFGARSTFVYPILLLFVANYYVKKKLNKTILLILLPITLFASVTVVLAYKNYTLSQDFVKTKSIFEIYSAYREYQNISQNSWVDDSDVKDALSTLFTNTCFIQESAMLIRYTNLDDRAMAYRILVMKEMALIPVNAFFPKFLQGGNNFPWGLWLKDEVLSHNVGLNYSLALSPLGYLYLGGGFVFILIAFWFYGGIVKIASKFLMEKSLMFILVYLIMLSYVYNFDSIVSGVFINVIRVIFIFPLIIWFMFGKFKS